MKTYIVFTQSAQFVATAANSKSAAYKKVVDAGYSAIKGSVTISSVHYDFCSNSIKLQ